MSEGRTGEFHFSPSAGRRLKERLSPSLSRILSWGERSRSVFWLLGAAILFFAFLSLWQRNQMIRIGYEIEQLRQQKAELFRIQKELLVEAESLDALERIERIAIQQLQMKPALPQQRVRIKGSSLPIPPSEIEPTQPGGH